MSLRYEPSSAGLWLTERRKRDVGLASLLGPVDPSFRALAGRLKYTVRRHMFQKDYLCWQEYGSQRDGGGTWAHTRLPASPPGHTRSTFTNMFVVKD